MSAGHERIGFVGPGRMGRPMVDRLLAAGHPVSVLARRPGVRTELAEAGARVVDSVADAVSDAGVVLVCLFSDEQIAEVADELRSGLRPGAVVASHVTGRRAALLELGARLRDRGCGLVDAPVSGGADDIRAGRLTVLLGGDDGDVDQVDAVVAAYSASRIRTGPLGSALAAKLVNNLLFAAHTQTAASAFELAARLGIERSVLLEVLHSSSGRSYAATTLGAVGPVSQWAAAVGEFLRKDVAACEAELADAGVDGGALGDVVRKGPLRLVDD